MIRPSPSLNIQLQHSYWNIYNFKNNHLKKDLRNYVRNHIGNCTGNHIGNYIGPGLKLL